MRDNKIQTIPAEIGYLTKLKVLFAQGNKLKWLPPQLVYCAPLFDTDGVRLAGNPLVDTLVSRLKVSVRAALEYLKTFVFDYKIM
jgi:Leucine-rich repeat (LRR) protein